jgi:preprotein translocase subunit SecG
MPTFLSGISSGLRKFLTKDRVIVLVGFIVLAIVFMYYSTGKITVRDGMSEGKAKLPSTGEKKKADTSAETQESAVSQGPSAPETKESFQGYSEKEVANPSELLPNDENSQWSSLNPVSQSNPQMPDMLQAGYHIGLDTIGQTMKNANLQLRSDPVIQKGEIGPWNQSTIEPDLMRVPLEVGCSTDK